MAQHLAAPARRRSPPRTRSRAHAGAPPTWPVSAGTSTAPLIHQLGGRGRAPRRGGLAGFRCCEPHCLRRAGTTLVSECRTRR